jgi:hypothetical protein
MTLDTKELLRLAAEKWKTEAEIVKHTGLSRATIWRMRNEKHKSRDKSIGKLVKALANG